MPSQTRNFLGAFNYDRAHFWQIARFGITGVALTAFVSATYYLLITFTPTSPAMALTLGTIAASVLGYFAHGSFSFRGFGSRDNLLKRFTRFLATNGIGYLMNLSYVYVMIDLLHWPRWLPVIGFCIVTPLASFLLYRKWVFG